MRKPYYPNLPISVAVNLTILMISSPRPTDMQDVGYSLLANLASTKRALSIPAETIVIFDGLRGRLKYNSTAIQTNYLRKVNHVIQSRVASVVVHEEWLHLAEATRRVMLGVKTPLFFLIQEDQMLDGTTIPLPSIREVVTVMLQSNTPVQSVHFPQLKQGGLKRINDCICYIDLNVRHPCAHHPTLPLCSTNSFNDQPHLATRTHYMTNIWPIIPQGYRTATEHHAIELALHWKWKGWLYAGPGYCVHTKAAGVTSSYGARTGNYHEG
jgi:hypothetical protein